MHSYIFYSRNKGFHFFDDFRKSMQTAEYIPNAKQLEDNSSMGSYRIKPEGDDSFGYLSRFA